MTKDEAMKLALEAFKDLEKHRCLHYPNIVKALEEALAKQRTWVGLNNEERLKLYRKFEDCLESDGWEYEKAIEAELKEKNT